MPYVMVITLCHLKKDIEGVLICQIYFLDVLITQHVLKQIIRESFRKEYVKQDIMETFVKLVIKIEQDKDKIYALNAKTKPLDLL